MNTPKPFVEFYWKHCSLCSVVPSFHSASFPGSPSLILCTDGRTVRDGKPRPATSTLAQLLSSNIRVSSSVLFTSTETVRNIRDGEPRMATSIFTQFLSSGCAVKTSVFLSSVVAVFFFHSLQADTPRSKQWQMTWSRLIN